MEKIQRLFNTIQEKIDEKWENKYVELDCKMLEREQQVDNNNGHIDNNCKGLRDQGNKLINVEAKIYRDKEKRILVCEDLKEQNREIVNYIEGNTEIRNSTVNEMNMDYRVGEYRNFKQFRKGFMKNYWGTMEQSVIQGEWYGIRFRGRLKACCCSSKRRYLRKEEPKKEMHSYKQKC
ncbi:hypothetical protein FQA39_LY14101 [Lamprigera yunnana]|nr:hypothetical protein FQA39_LY14101 [Lamprigera yunnana]